MKDILSLVVIFSVFGGIFVLAVKTKSTNTKNSDIPPVSSRKTIFGPATFMVAILMFLWGIFCFFGGPEAERGLRPVIYGVIFTLSSIIIGYKSL